MSYRMIRDIIMGQILLTLPLQATVREAARRMNAAKVGAVIVVDGKQVAGIFTERDVVFRVVAEGLDPDHTPLASVMTTDIATVTPDSRFVDALKLMDEGGFRHVPVIDKGLPVGMVSIRDAMGQELVDRNFELQREQDQLLEQRFKQPWA